jgi:hypothetical protein
VTESKQSAVAATARMRIGAPATPIDHATVELIVTLVEGLEAIAEAYLPMVYIPEVIDPPAITLVIVPQSDVHNVAKLADVLSAGLKLILDGGSMQIIPLPPDGGIAQAVRKSGMQIFPRPPGQSSIT